MDRMREEFEAWHTEQCKADGMDWRDLSSELDRDGDGYVYTGAQYSWRAWKASRAALCVELPKITDFAKDSRGSREVLNFEFAVECVARELNDVGVRHE